LGCGRQASCQGPQAGADFQDGLTAAQAGRGDDATQRCRIDEEVLPETLVGFQPVARQKCAVRAKEIVDGAPSSGAAASGSIQGQLG
jgi:hypothetical protein